MKKGITFYSNPLKSFGGEGEIRTPGGVTHTRFPIVLLRPARTPLHYLFPALGTKKSTPVCFRVQALCAVRKRTAWVVRLCRIPGGPGRSCLPQVFAFAAFRRRIAFFPPFQVRHIGRAGATMGKGGTLGPFSDQPCQADHKHDGKNAPEHGGSAHGQVLWDVPTKDSSRSFIPCRRSCRSWGVPGGCVCPCGRLLPVEMPRVRRWQERQCRWH